MDSTTRFEIELPRELADVVRQRVSSGRYASESDVFAEGVLRLVDEDENHVSDPAIDAELAAGYDAWKANPEGGIPLEEAARRLREESERRHPSA